MTCKKCGSDYCGVEGMITAILEATVPLPHPELDEDDTSDMVEKMLRELVVMARSETESDPSCLLTNPIPL